MVSYTRKWLVGVAIALGAGMSLWWLQSYWKDEAVPQIEKRFARQAIQQASEQNMEAATRAIAKSEASGQVQDRSTMKFPRMSEAQAEELMVGLIDDPFDRKKVGTVIAKFGHAQSMVERYPQPVRRVKQAQLASAFWRQLDVILGEGSDAHARIVAKLQQEMK